MLARKLPALLLALAFSIAPALGPSVAVAADVPVASVEGQPLAANCARLLEALEYLGAPLPRELDAHLRAAIAAENAARIQELLDARVLFVIGINPELRVKAQRGPGEPALQQGGYMPLLIKVLNDATLARRLRISSPQSGPLYAGAAEAILKRQAQTELNDNENKGRQRRFLDVEIFDKPPMTNQLSGLKVEYLCAAGAARRAFRTRSRRNSYHRAAGVSRRRWPRLSATGQAPGA
jgi:hypothetical protein